LDDDSEEKFKTANLEVSASAFVVYLGVKKDLSKLMNKHMCTWYFPTYDIEKCYDVYGRYRLSGESLGLQEVDYLICHFPSLVDPGVAPKNRSSIRIELWVSQTSINSWAIYKERLYQLVLRKLEELIPGVSSLIELVEIATPQTINKWVSSADGAIFGWAATVNQEDRNVFPPKTSVDGLYLTGSWATNGFGQCGVPIVTLSGQKTADLIKRKFKIVNPPISTLS
jgi:prolycopene isomerase